VALPAFSDQPGAQFLLFPTHAGAAAQNAGSADPDGIGSFYFNPATINQMDSGELTLTHAQTFNFNYYDELGLRFPVSGQTYAGMRALYVSSADLLELDASAQPVGNLTHYDFLLQLAWAQNFFSPDLQIGVGCKWLSSRLAEFSRYGLGADLGLYYHFPVLPLSLGLSLMNFGVLSAFALKEEALPLQLRSGFGWEIFDRDWWLIRLLGDWEQSLAQKGAYSARVGLDVKMAKQIRMRLGLSYNPSGQIAPVAGAGWEWWRLALDYAFAPMEKAAQSHRLTLSYFWPTGQSLPMDSKAEMSAPATLAEEALFAPQIRELRSSPRSMESSITISIASGDDKVDTWTFAIKDDTGKIVKKITGLGSPPKTFRWDGRGESGNLLPRESKYEFILSTNEKNQYTSRLPELPPVVRLAAKQNDRLPGEVQFDLSKRPEVRSWSLLISEPGNDTPQARFAGSSPLPPILNWNGRDSQGRVVDAKKNLIYQLELEYPDRSRVTIAEPIYRVAAEVVQRGAQKWEVTIAGILFDNDSALLKPEMENKLIATAQLLNNHATDAEAVCEGHADQMGSQLYNLELSRLRAEMVKNFLVQKLNVPAAQLRITGFGKRRPLSPGRSEEDRAKNRRVEIRITIAPTPSAGL
jgi:outer membrane protein OmpA-like peptidoglycan-associated protein